MFINSYPTLEEADENIEAAGKLEPLVIEIAGNKRSYDTAVHKITKNDKVMLFKQMIFTGHLLSNKPIITGTKDIF